MERARENEMGATEFGMIVMAYHIKISSPFAMACQERGEYG
jgi:hypothetical protein